ncbi:MAG TPA: potassium channel family protein, partial [Gemmataceae bacterium]|nr:potassium channel family protein [Gemmataceae bacterium]
MTRRHRVLVRVRGIARRCQRWFRTHIPRRVWSTLLIAGTLLGTGTVGYRWIEGEHWSYFDGFYMTAITLTTIGYGETHELSTRGRAFTVVLAYGGIFTLAYFASELVRAAVTGELRDVLGRQRVDAELAELNGHTIVCGCGRMGRIICAELDRLGKRFVVLDRAAELLAELPYEFGLPLHGDA